MRMKTVLGLCTCVVLLLLCSFAKLRDPFFYDFVRYPGEVYTVIGIGRIRPTDQYFAVIRVWQRLHYIFSGDTFGLYTVKEICSRAVVLEDTQKRCCTLYIQDRPTCITAINSA